MVVISNRCKLDYKMGYMVVRGEDTKKIFIDEIAVLMLENTAISMTGCLLEALVERKVRVIFCDGKKSPVAELAPYYGSYDCSRKIKTQLLWDKSIKGIVWAEIVADKIRKQSEFLNELGHDKEASLIQSYIPNIEENDSTNREGHAAKVYFNGIFGMDFTRGEDCAVNAALNYGYSIILSAFNREITACGYLTQIGLFHDNMFNFYNLSCDLMEPFRIIIDRVVYTFNFTDFSSDEKRILLNVLNHNVLIDGQKQTVLNAIKIYSRSVFDAINDKDVSIIKTYKSYEL